MIFRLISLPYIFQLARPFSVRKTLPLKYLQVIFTLILLAVSLNNSFAQTNSSANSPRIDKLRLWHSPDSTRVVFDVSGNVKHSVFSLANPTRIVVDINDSSLVSKIPSLDPNNAHISAIRTGQPKRGVLRFVFELKKVLQQQSFVLSPNELYGHRLVLDLTDPHATTRGSSLADSSAPVGLNTLPSVANANVPPVVDSRPEAVSPSPPALLLRETSNRPLIVAIDAGHGGEDPGAIGYRGSHEKKLTLEIAKRLKKVIDADPRMQAKLVRTGDYYIKLHSRRVKARDQGADIFISIHADAFTKRSARGFSVFALSQSGATSAMASTLAAKENASDSIGGVSLADKDEILAKVLVDLSMTNTISESVNLGGRVLKELSKLGRLHSKRVEQAGFAVLKTPDMPSILVETGFITNPEEERKLRTSSYQNKIARAIYTAIDQYAKQTPHFNKGSYTAPNIGNSNSVASGRSNNTRSSTTSEPIYHKVVRGDSLSKIADRYGVSLKSLKQANNLRSNTAVLGKRLKISGSTTRVANSSPQSTSTVHVVKRGDSLSRISADYNVTIRALKNHNNLRRDTVFLGQRIKIPGSSARVSTRVASSSSRAIPAVHVVKRGDSLSSISADYNVTIRALKKHNNLKKDTLLLGQRIKLPGGSASVNSRAVVAKPITHKVKRGDTLSEIAQKYRSSIKAIMRANNMRSRTIQLGQVLKIPS